MKIVNKAWTRALAYYHHCQDSLYIHCHATRSWEVTSHLDLMLYFRCTGKPSWCVSKRQRNRAMVCGAPWWPGSDAAAMGKGARYGPPGVL